MQIIAGIRNTLAVTLLGLLVPAAADICSDLEAATSTSGILTKPFSLAYEHEVQNYWSAACASLRPTCMMFPTSANEVASIVQALHRTDDLFAVKSGGHMPNNGFSSIQGGLLLSTKKLNNIVAYDPDTQTAKVGPGLTWSEAQAGLEGTGRALVGGRLGGVGIGGYILGGGLSFLSSQHGWAANNVVDFEVVLANGTIVHANDSENQDLYAALKGGGSNFGIVTQYTFKTHPISDKVWGGVITYSKEKTPEILEAIRNFAEYYPDDKAAIIPTCERTSLFTSWFVFFFYDGATPPPELFANFTSISSQISTVKTWDSYHDLLQSNDQYNLNGQRYAIATETTPLPSAEVGTEVFSTIWETFYNITTDVLLDVGVIGTIAFQPLSRTISSKAKSRGGDLMAFPDTTDYIVFELDISHSLSIDDDTTEAAIQALYTKIGNRIEKYIEEGTLPNVYRPLFMNDAHGTQDYWGRISPDSRELAKQVRERYDPDKFWQIRTSGGFRLG